MFEKAYAGTLQGLQTGRKLLVFGRSRPHRGAEAVTVEQLERGSSFSFEIKIVAAPNDQHPRVFIDVRVEEACFLWTGK